jgi:hypothetical protein
MVGHGLSGAIGLSVIKGLRFLDAGIALLTDMIERVLHI